MSIGCARFSFHYVQFMKSKIQSLLGCVLGLALFVVPAASAKEKTALQLVKDGNEYVGKDSKDKVVQIRSEKSVGDLEPQIWFIVYYDPDATFKATEVKFGSGRKLTVKRPFRMIEYVTADKQPLDPAKLKVDSDRAIQVAIKEPLLGKLSLKATQLWLQRGDGGPVWKVRLWAQKLSEPAKMAIVGDVYVSSADASVVRSDLRIDRVN